MRYLSPTSLPDSPPIDPPDKKALLRRLLPLVTSAQQLQDSLAHHRHDSIKFFQ